MTPQMMDEILATIKAVADKLVARIDRTDERLRELEQRPANGCEYLGVHQQGRAYARGCLVTRSGGLWLATSDTAAAPGSPEGNWKLIVKEGAAR